MAEGPRPPLLTLPFPRRTAVSREPGRWRPRTDRLLLFPGRAGAPRPSARKSRAPARTFCPEGGGGALNPAARRPGASGAERESRSVESGPRGLPSQPTRRERPCIWWYSFICPAVIRWAGPLRGQRLRTLNWVSPVLLSTVVLDRL